MPPISCTVAAQLIWAFLFANAKSRFSHKGAHMIAYHIAILELMCSLFILNLVRHKNTVCMSFIMVKFHFNFKLMLTRLHPKFLDQGLLK